MGISTPHGAVQAALGMTAITTYWLIWTWIVIAHLFLIQIAVIAIWVTGATFDDVSAWLSALLQTRIAAALSVLGLSILLLVGLYWRIVKLAHGLIGNPGSRIHRAIEDVIRKAAERYDHDARG
jgi:hypothetical protein